jgi:HAD superfamily hydrolase (TIGR01509 family)
MTILPTNITTIMWDMDGTLVDSEPLHAQTGLHVQATLGAPITHALYAQTVGMNHRKTYDYIKAHTPALVADFDTWFALCAQTYLQLVPQQLQPRQNIPTLLSQLHAKNFKQGIYSNSDRAGVHASRDVVINQAGLNPFLHTLAIEDVTQGKPAPDGYLQLANLLQTPIAQCAVVEDSITGLTAAHKAGAFTIFWPQDVTLLEKAGDMANLIVRPECDLVLVT